jgi:hypothetical protein
MITMISVPSSFPQCQVLFGWQSLRDDEHIGIASLARRTKTEHPEIVVII